MRPVDARSDLRLEAALGRWLHDEAPDAAPPDLARRVIARSTAGAQRLGRRHRPGAWPRTELWRAGAAAVVVVVATASVLAALPAIAPAAPSPRPLSTSCLGTDPAASAAAGSERRAVGRLHVGRTGHTATGLGDCRVLIVGGGSQDTEATASVELWDPTQASVTELAPARTARVVHAAVLLDDGRVLVVGGLERGPGGEILGPDTTAEVWDPATLAFTDAGTVGGPFAMPTATLLEDGRVLVLGGGSGRTDIVAWDPLTGGFEPAGSLVHGRAGGQTATLLPDGSVLVIGGFEVSIDADGEALVTALPTVEVWDPETGVSHEAPPLPDGRYDHTTTLLPDGRIIVTGGLKAVPADPTRQVPSDDVLVRDPISGVFHAAGRLSVPRSGHAAELMADGRLLLVGGEDVPSSIEAWDPITGMSQRLPPASVRLAGVATRLPDGTLLLSGGTSTADPASPNLDLEVYDPAP